jgi:splicing factor 1
MKELGESNPGSGADSGRSAFGGDITGGGSNIPPWRRPEVWQSNVNQQGGGNFRTPQQGYSGYSGQQGYAQQGQGQGWGAYGYPQQGGYSGQQDYSAMYGQYYQGQYDQQQQPR